MNVIETLTAKDLRLIGLFAQDGAVGTRNSDNTVTVQHPNGDVMRYERMIGRAASRRWTLAA